MSYSVGQAREELLAAAHRVMGGRIDDRPQGPNDDAEAEYAEDGLIAAAGALARAKLAERLEKSAGEHKSALEHRILRTAEQIADDATAGTGGDHRLKQAGAEAAVMELALVEIVAGVEAGTLLADAASEMAAQALPEGAGKA